MCTGIGKLTPHRPKNLGEISARKFESEEKRTSREQEREREKKHVYTRTQLTTHKNTPRARAKQQQRKHARTQTHTYTINNILINEPKWGDINIRGAVHETFDVDGEVS